jgi:hypothetical protein
MVEMNKQQIFHMHLIHLPKTKKFFIAIAMYRLLVILPKVEHNYQWNRYTEPRRHRPIPAMAKFCDIMETHNTAMSFKSSFVCWPANLLI